MSGDRSEQDAVAEVAGGDIVPGDGGCAEDGQSVWRARAKSGPVFEDFSLGELRN